MNSNQIKALAGFMNAVEAACVEHGVELNCDVEVHIADGHGGKDAAVVWRQDDDGDEWHLEGKSYT